MQAIFDNVWPACTKFDSALLAPCCQDNQSQLSIEASGPITASDGTCVHKYLYWQERVFSNQAACWWRVCIQISIKDLYLKSGVFEMEKALVRPFSEFFTTSSNIIKHSVHVCWTLWLWSPHEYVNCGVCNKIKTFWNSCKVPELLVVLWVGHGNNSSGAARVQNIRS